MAPYSWYTLTMTKVPFDAHLLIGSHNRWATHRMRFIPNGRGLLSN